ncbi:MAG: DUF3164 family protein [Bacteroidetes bacterium]|nr:DUF3164 family protein [Bacteroidota bacterium]
MEDYLTDAKGRLVPKGQIKEVDLLRHELVYEIIEKAKIRSKDIAQFKRGIMNTIKSFIELSAEQYGQKYGGHKGNVTLTSFDGKYRITIAIQDTISFDERLQVAKQLIDECIQKWSDGSRDEIRVLVQDAFNVEKGQKLNTDRILGLRRLDIQDPVWKQAMDAISDSVTISSSKEHIRVHERNLEGKYQQIRLDLSSL